MDISSATARVVPDLIKTLPILSDTTVGRSAVDQKDLKPYIPPVDLRQLNPIDKKGAIFFLQFGPLNKLSLISTRTRQQLKSLDKQTIKIICIKHGN